MDWLERMNNSIGYIEENLADEISFDKAAEENKQNAPHSIK